MVNNLFGLFFAIFQVNQIFGNIISSTVIGDGFPSFSDLGKVNVRNFPKTHNSGGANDTEIELLRAKCGLNQVNEASSCEAGAIDDQTLYLLMGKIFFFLLKFIVFYRNIQCYYIHLNPNDNFRCRRF